MVKNFVMKLLNVSVKNNGTDAVIKKIYKELYWRKYTHMNEHSAVAFTISTIAVCVALLGSYGCAKVEDRAKHQITQTVLDNELKNQIILREKDVQLQCLKMKFKPSECGIK